MSQLVFQVLVLNCGSSSIKCAVVDAVSGQRSADVLVERIGSDQALLILNTSAKGGSIEQQLGQVDYQQACAAVLSSLENNGIDLQQINAVAHRVVHGGAAFKSTVLIDDKNIAALREIEHLAPLHNPANLAGIDFMRQKLPAKPQFMTFDTAFHATIPDYAHIYPIPYDYYQKLGVRKYGFHGTSHQFVSAKAADFLSLDSEYGIVTAHLGNGCSLAAVHNGRSVDTTMGLTPLDGVMMGTRSGAIDPSIHQYLQQVTDLSLLEITEILNKKSGFLGISGISHDMRDVERAAAKGNKQAQCALAMFSFSVSKSVFAMCASLPKLDAIVFTGGIGENSAALREQVISRCKMLGVVLDVEKNNSARGKKICKISVDNNTKISPAVLVIKTDEEWQMAKEALAVANK
jgi:acetate kinase